jgi:hypothetical protein
MNKNYEVGPHAIFMRFMFLLPSLVHIFSAPSCAQTVDDLASFSATVENEHNCTSGPYMCLHSVDWDNFKFAFYLFQECNPQEQRGCALLIFS